MTRIGFDGKRAVNNMTGLGNYSRLVIDVMSACYPENEYAVYAPGRRENPRLSRLLERGNVSMVTPDTAFGRKLPSLWRVSGVTSQLVRDKIDLFHGLSNELPLTVSRAAFPTVVTIHDLIFRHFPECYKPIDRMIYDYKFRKAAERATRVIAISQCTRRDLVEMYGVDPSKIDVIYQGCDSQFRRDVTPVEIAEVKRKYGLDRPYVIGVGTIEKRKNQLLTVKALRGLPDDVGVVLVGRRRPYSAEIERYVAGHHLGGRFKVIEGADFKDFPALYAGALAASYPSRFEGFGLPVIEALSVGTPVVVASGSCLEEAAGGKAPVVGPDDSQALAFALRRLIEDSAFRAEVIADGRRHALGFDDATFAAEIMNTYNKAICQRDC